MNKILEFEFLRGIAAFYVFFHHTLFQFNIIEKNSLLGRFFSFGQEAVMLFFLLSGYVIALSLIKKDYSFSEYFKHRFLRIYPILLFVMIVSIILKFLNNDLNIDFYSFIINLLMLQDIGSLKPGTFAEPFLGNSPLWSLSYEWWFYMIFFVHFIFYKKIFTNISFLYSLGFIFSILGLVSYFFFYNQISLIIMYYYIWLSGAIICIIFINKLPNKEKSKICFVGDLVDRGANSYDVVKFVKREIRRGNKYDAIIMDPPSYGRGSNGEVWDIEKDLAELVSLCCDILVDNPLFFLINSYTTGLSSTVLANLLTLTVDKHKKGKITCGEIGLPIKNSNLILPCGIYGRWESCE